MRQIRTRLPAIIALILGFASPAPAQDSGPRSFSGEYAMEGWGLGPFGIGYRGSCSVLGDGPAYRVSCINSSTRHIYIGKGLALGETLSIFVGDELAGGDPGPFSGEYLVVYRRQSSGVLEGTWLHAWSGTAGIETLTPTQ